MKLTCQTNFAHFLLILYKQYLVNQIMLVLIIIFDNFLIFEIVCFLQLEVMFWTQVNSTPIKWLKVNFWNSVFSKLKSNETNIWKGIVFLKIYLYSVLQNCGHASVPPYIFCTINIRRNSARNIIFLSSCNAKALIK